MIQVYKTFTSFIILTHYFFIVDHRRKTKGHDKILKNPCNLEVRKYSFSNTVVNCLRGSPVTY